MADPLSIMYLVLSVVQVTQNAYKLVNSIKNVDSKIDQLYYRLVAEREITEAWANQMRLTAGNDLRSTIPPDKYGEVKTILDKLTTYYGKAEAKYRRVDPKNTAVEKSTLARLKTRAVYVVAGFDEVKDLVDTITIMNTALRTIAPPLPPYTIPIYTGGQGAPTLVSVPQATVEANSVASWSSIGDVSSTIAPGSSRATTLVQRHDSFTPDPRPVPPDPNIAHLPALCTIYSLCLEGLSLMALRRGDKQLKNAVSRLRLWGAGMFEQPAPLDKALALDDKAPSATRQAFIKTIASILVLEERDLNRLREGAEGAINTTLTSMQTEVSSILGTDELVETALEEWARYMEEKNLKEEHGEPGDDWEHFTEHRLMRGPTGSCKLNDEDDTTREFNIISRTIEILFDLLPALRAEKRQFAYEMRGIETAKIALNDTAPIALESKISDDTASVIDDDLDKIETFIKKRDERATRQGRRPTLFEPAFRKQRERLAELQVSGKANATGDPADEAESAKMRAKKEEIRKTITLLARQIALAGEAKQPTVPAPAKVTNTTTKLDVKTPIVDRQAQEDELVSGILESLGNIQIG